MPIGSILTSGANWYNAVANAPHDPAPSGEQRLTSLYDKLFTAQNAKKPSEKKIAGIQAQIDSLNKALGRTQQDSLSRYAGIVNPLGGSGLNSAPAYGTPKTGGGIGSIIGIGGIALVAIGGGIYWLVKKH